MSLRKDLIYNYKAKPLLYVAIAALVAFSLGPVAAKAIERKEIKVLTPQCEEKVPSGSYKLITWSGVAATDSVNILLSVNNGASWDTLARKVDGLKYLAKMPDIESDSCLVRISSTRTVSGSFKLRHNGEINAACFSGNGAYIATFGGDSVANVWNADTGELIFQTPKQNGKLIAGAIDFDGNNLAGVCSDSCVVVWDVKTGAERMRLPKLPFRPLCVDFSPNGKYMLLGGLNGIINFYLAPSFTFLLQAQPDKTYPVWDAHFMPDGDKILLTAGGFAEVYDWTKSRSIFKYDTRQGESYGDVRQVSFNSDATLIAAASLTSKKAFVFNEGVALPSGEFSHMDTTRKTIITTDFFRDPSFGEVLLTGGVDKRAKLSVVSTGTALTEFIAHSNTVTAAKFHPSGDRILTASLDSTAIVWKGNLDIIADGVTPCPFSLVKQNLTIKTVDFDTVIVTKKSWKSPTEYIINSSKIPVRIDSVSVSADAPFKVTLNSALPLTLQPGDSVRATCLFAPLKGDSQYVAVAIVYSEDIEFTGVLKGFGLELGLAAYPDEIRFPLAETGTIKDSLVKSAIFNLSSKEIRINNATIQGDAPSQFSLLSPIDGTVLQPGDSLDLNIRFAPTTDKAASAYVKLNHDGKGDTAVYLFGESVTIVPDSVIVTCAKFRAEAGQIIKNPISISYPDFAGAPIEVEAEAQFNPTTLLPLGEFSDVYLDNLSRIIKVKHTLNLTNGAFSLDFKALLGNDTTTAISLRNVKVTGPGRYAVLGLDGGFTLEGYCVEGGLRLYDPFSETKILTQIAYPLKEATEIRFETRGNGQVEMDIYAENGSRAKQLLNRFLPKGAHSVILQPEQIAPGFYLLTLSSGPDTIVKKIIISR